MEEKDNPVLLVAVLTSVVVKLKLIWRFENADTRPALLLHLFNYLQ